jgi:nicotinate-nucleotide adenylyltransferase
VRYGILGGSFDPIHRGHVAAAEAVRAHRGLHKVFLVPAADPPHKTGCVASFADRVAMARLAVAGRPRLEVLDLEGDRPGPSYTIDTVHALQERWPGAEFELLVGTDMLVDLPTWHRSAELRAAVHVVAFARPGVARPADTVPCAWVEVPPVAVSATEVRRRLAEGKDVTELLDPAVFTYIRRKGLYRAG